MYLGVRRRTFRISLHELNWGCSASFRGVEPLFSDEGKWEPMDDEGVVYFWLKQHVQEDQNC